MRFRFCWDCDCPDWLLAEMTTLSKLTSIKLRLLSTQVAKTLIEYPTQPINYDNMLKLTSDAKLDAAGTKAVVAAVHWIMESAAGSHTDGHVLDSELQQLGLPKEHAAALTKVYSEHQDKIRASLMQRSLKVSKGTTWDTEVKGVDIGGGHLQPVTKLKISKNNDTKEVCLTFEQVNALLEELTEARQMMEEVQ